MFISVIKFLILFLHVHEKKGDDDGCQKEMGRRKRKNFPPAEAAHREQHFEEYGPKWAI